MLNTGEGQRSASVGRYYGLDALRACMMLLGIALHLALPYAGVPSPGYYVTQERSVFLFVVILVTHYVRMPTFFLLGGFFSALLWQRDGTRQFLRVRLRRVGLVWLAALVALWPIVAVIGVYNHYASQGGNALVSTWTAILTRKVDRSWLQEGPMHLWFLEYLMLFCLVAAAIHLASRGFLATLDRWTGRVFSLRFRIVPLAIPTAVVLSRMQFAVVPYPSNFVPWLGVSLAYGWYYAVGWLLYRRRDLLSSLATKSKGEMAALPVLIAIYVVLSARHLKLPSGSGAVGLELAIAFFTALMIWSAIFALIGLFYRVKPTKWLPYLADASYWIYLMHFPFAVLLPALLRNWLVLPVVKVSLSTVFILLIGLATYENFVRYTWVGRALNGARVRTAVPDKRTLVIQADLS